MSNGVLLERQNKAIIIIIIIIIIFQLLPPATYLLCLQPTYRRAGNQQPAVGLHVFMVSRSYDRNRIVFNPRHVRFFYFIIVQPRSVSPILLMAFFFVVGVCGGVGEGEGETRWHPMFKRDQACSLM